MAGALLGRLRGSTSPPIRALESIVIRMFVYAGSMVTFAANNACPRLRHVQRQQLQRHEHRLVEKRAD